MISCLQYVLLLPKEPSPKLAQLFVSLLTITCGYTKAVMGLMIVDAMTLILEFWWIQVVYNQFPALHSKKKTLGPGNDQEEGSEDQDVQAGFKKDFWSDWADFASMPIFYCLSFCYLCLLH